MFYVRKWLLKFKFYIDINAEKSWKLIIWSTKQHTHKHNYVVGIALKDYKNTKPSNLTFRPLFFALEICMTYMYRKNIWKKNTCITTCSGSHILSTYLNALIVDRPLMVSENNAYTGDRVMLSRRWSSLI